MTRVVFQGSNAAFEEVVLLAFFGRNHQHFNAMPVMATDRKVMPNIRDRYLLPNGAVDFGLIRSDFADMIDARIPNSCDRNQTRSTNIDCTVFSVWLQPGDRSRDWIKRQVGWRVVYPLRSLSGKSMDMKKTHDGPRRLVLESFVEIGFRRNPQEPLRTVFAAGPLHQEAYRPVGYAELSSAAWHLIFEESNVIEDRLRTRDLAFSERSASLTERDKLHYYALVAAEESHLVDFARDLQDTLAQQLRR